MQVQGLLSNQNVPKKYKYCKIKGVYISTMLENAMSTKTVN